MTMSAKAFTQFAHHDMRFNRECQQYLNSVSQQRKRNKVEIRKNRTYTSFTIVREGNLSSFL